MRRLILANILSSGVEKLFVIAVQFLSSILVIRLLPRDDYGVIGVVAGYFAFVSFINVSLESIMLKEHKAFDEKRKEVLQAFFVFNLFKALLFVVIATLFTLVLPGFYENSGFVYAIWSITFIMIADSVTAPFVIYFAAKLNQKLVTKLGVFRAALGLALLTGLFAYPQLWYIALKDLAVSTVFIAFWLYLARKRLDFRPTLSVRDFAFIRRSFLDYALWTHLNGVVTTLIYRSDTFFLSFFVGLSVVGNYTIGLNSANIANILPSILGYQNSIALSHARDREHAVTISNAFVRASVVLGVLTLAAFFLLGHFYLELITGQPDNDAIYFYMMCIVTGLVLVKGFASPINAFINIRGDVRALFRNVMIVLLCFTLIAYLSAAFFTGAHGVALSNIPVALLWLFMVLREAKKYHYSFSSVMDFSAELSWIKKAGHRWK